MKKKLLNLLSQTLKLAIAAGLLYYLFHSGRLSQENLKVLWSWQILVAGLLIQGIVFLTSSERWRLLLNQQNLHLTRWKCFRLSLIGTFFNFFVPGGVGGDVVKAVLVAQNHPSQRAKAVLTVLADRILGLFTMVFLALVAFVFEPELLNQHSFQVILIGLIVLFLGFLTGFWILLSSHTQGLRDQVGRLTQKAPKLHKLWEFAQTYHMHPRQSLSLVALSLIGQILNILLFVVVGHQLPEALPSLSVFFFAVPVGFMVTAIPLAPAGIGIGQAAFFYLFSQAAGHETQMGVVGITASQAFQLLFGLVGAIFFVLLKKENPQLHLPTSDESSGGT